MLDLTLWASLFGGLLVLALAGDFLVSGALVVAKRLNWSPLLAGILIVGFGTSAPEVFVSLTAALDGSPGLAFGNLIGSNIANILLVLAVPAVLIPLSTDFYGIRRSYLVLLAVTFVFIVLTLFGTLDARVGYAFFLALIGYVLTSLRSQTAPEPHLYVSQSAAPPHSVFTILIKLTLGLLGLPLGAYLVVEGGVGIARAFEVSEYYIGLTLLAIGTSLPELSAALAAAFRKQAGVLVGNVIGSNLLNLLGAGGVLAFFGPLYVPQGFLLFDYYVLGLATLLLGDSVLRKVRISRLAGAGMLLIYALYLLGLIKPWNFSA